VTLALLDRPAPLFADSPAGGGAPEGRRVGGGGRVGGGRMTLEERLEATLASLLAAGEAECPVCHARMTRTHDGGACGGCGSSLS
jgi:hypothetical protein